MESLGVYLFAGAFRFFGIGFGWRSLPSPDDPETISVIERARRTPARIVEIERTRRGTAYRNMLKRHSAKAVLERELERLIGEWSRA
jgi:hypothetical protein